MQEYDYSYKFDHSKYSEDLSLEGKRTKEKRPREYRMCACSKHVKLISAHCTSEVSSCQICNQDNHINILKENGMQVTNRLGHARYSVIMPCGHLKSAGVTALIDSKHFCKTCADDAIIRKFNNFGVGVVEIGTAYTSIRFKCGHEATRKTYSQDKPVCLICEETNKNAFLDSLGVIQLTVEDYKLSCGHVVNTVNYNKFDKYKCPKCHEEAVKLKAESLGMSYLGVKNEKHERELTLPCGHKKFLRYKSINDRVTCAICEDTHYAKPCDLYVLTGYSNGLSFVKVGVAGILKDRIKEYRAKHVGGWFNVSNIGFPDKYTAIKYEKEFHLKFKDRRIDPEEMKNHMKEGFTECYPSIMLTEILDYFRPVLNQYGGSNKFKEQVKYVRE